MGLLDVIGKVAKGALGLASIKSSYDSFMGNNPYPNYDKNYSKKAAAAAARLAQARGEIATDSEKMLNQLYTAPDESSQYRQVTDQAINRAIDRINENNQNQQKDLLVRQAQQGLTGGQAIGQMNRLQGQQAQYQNQTIADMQYQDAVRRRQEMLAARMAKQNYLENKIRGLNSLGVYAKKGTLL